MLMSGSADLILSILSPNHHDVVFFLYVLYGFIFTKTNFSRINMLLYSPPTLAVGALSPEFGPWVLVARCLAQATPSPTFSIFRYSFSSSALLSEAQ